MLKNLLRTCLRVTVNSLLIFLDAVLPPLPEERPALKSATPPEPEPEPEPTSTPEPALRHVGTYPVGSHAEMFVSAEMFTPEQPPISEPAPITELVITLPPAPNDALVAIAEVLTLAPGRAQIVEALLDEAWQQGHTTYCQLIAYVKEQSGTGCSKKTVSAWKKSRQLDQVEAVAA